MDEDISITAEIFCLWFSNINNPDRKLVVYDQDRDRIGVIVSVDLIGEGLSVGVYANGFKRFNTTHVLGWL